MDKRFHPAMAAIKTGDLDLLTSLVKDDPTLATGRSSCGHPTLLQCLVLDAVTLPNKLQLAQVLIDQGADIEGSLVACASIDNVDIAEVLLDAGAHVDGIGSWSPLEESLYWGNQGMIDLLLARGARVQNLRTAAGTGRLEVVQSFFNSDGTLRPDTGRIDWPFGELQRSNVDSPIKRELQTKMKNWTTEPKGIINNAFIYACMGNHLGVAEFLLAQGAEPNAIPAGFDYAGTGLHYAALRGHRAMVDFLLDHGADPTIKDTKVGSTAAGWAAYGGHADLSNYLDNK